MPASSRIQNCEMKPGDRVTWLYSRKRPFMVGCGVERIPGVIVRVCKHRIRLRVTLHGKEKIVNVDPENVMALEEG